MKTLTLILMAVSLTGCASMATKWGKIEPGQTKDEVTDIMGDPSGISLAPAGGRYYDWAVNGYTTCRVQFNSDDKVDAKQCAVDQAALYQRQQLAMQYMQMQQNRPAMQSPIVAPRQTYQRPIQTNCTTTGANGMAQTSCSSAPTGIDASIYGN